MEKAALKLAWLDKNFFACLAVNDFDARAPMADAVTQFRCEIPLNLFARQGANALQERADHQFGAGGLEEHMLLRNAIRRMAFAHVHLIGAPIRTR